VLVDGNQNETEIFLAINNGVIGWVIYCIFLLYGVKYYDIVIAIAVTVYVVII